MSSSPAAAAANSGVSPHAFGVLMRSSTSPHNDAIGYAVGLLCVASSFSQSEGCVADSNVCVSVCEGIEWTQTTVSLVPTLILDFMCGL